MHPIHSNVYGIRFEIPFYLPPFCVHMKVLLKLIRSHSLLLVARLKLKGDEDMAAVCISRGNSPKNILKWKWKNIWYTLPAKTPVLCYGTIHEHTDRAKEYESNSYYMEKSSKFYCVAPFIPLRFAHSFNRMPWRNFTVDKRLSGAVCLYFSIVKLFVFFLSEKWLEIAERSVLRNGSATVHLIDFYIVVEFLKCTQTQI